MVSIAGMLVSLKTDLRFPNSGQLGHGSRIIQQCRIVSEKAIEKYDKLYSYCGKKQDKLCKLSEQFLTEVSQAKSQDEIDKICRKYERKLNYRWFFNNVTITYEDNDIFGKAGVIYHYKTYNFTDLDGKKIGLDIDILYIDASEETINEYREYYSAIFWKDINENLYLLLSDWRYK